MDRIYTCLAQQHDLRLVLVAGLTCLFASWTALLLARRSRASGPRARPLWLAAAATVAGSGVWATHFIAMLAFDPGLPVGYDPALTALSVLVAITLSGLGFTLAAYGASPWWAGAVVGAGVGAMHYTGMAALRLPALVHWDAPLVLASLLLGAGLGAAALRTALATDRPARVLPGAVLLALAICALHFTAMGAVRLEPSPLLPLPEQDLSPWWLAVAVAAATAVILAVATLAMVVDGHLAERTAREAARLRTLVDATLEGLVVHADGVILDLNESLAALLGRGRDGLLGRSALEVLAPEYAARAREHFTLDRTPLWEAELVRADGRRVPVEVLGRRIEYHGRPARVVAVRDITERRRAEQRIHHLAHHDPLTGLPNRVLFRDRLAQALARARRSAESVAVLCLDLDRFKEVNDVHGHAAGDALLQRVATTLQEGLRETDTVARLGGDEFAIVQVGLAQPGGAAQLAERLIEQVGRGAGLGEAGSDIGLSVGIAFFPEDDAGPEALLKKADMALYRAKADGRGVYRTFEPEMDARLQARRLLKRELRAALERGELRVHYQPQAAADSGRVVGFEALVRWPHPTRGAIAPCEFIPLAEECGLIRPLGEWVLRTACGQAATWPPHLRLGVNLSPVQFRADLPELVAAVLRETGLAAGRLELEITEGVLIKDADHAFAVLHELKELGVRIAMDDFGTGYSSLSYLQRFRFDRIKIDQSFIAGLFARPESESIVRAIIGLSSSLRVSIIAEGVETADQLAVLRREQCDEVQGYLIGRPMPPDEVLPFLGERTRAGATAAGADRGGRRPVLERLSPELPGAA